MRVTADRQTLILAGETPPRRNFAGDDDDSVVTVGKPAALASQRVTIISARVDAVVTQGVYSPKGVYSPNQAASTFESAESESAEPDPPIAQLPQQLSAVAQASVPIVASKAQPAYLVATRGNSASAARAYARTRDLSERTPPLIDTYA